MVWLNAESVRGIIVLHPQSFRPSVVPVDIVDKYTYICENFVKHVKSSHLPIYTTLGQKIQTPREVLKIKTN